MSASGATIRACKISTLVNGVTNYTVYSQAILNPITTSTNYTFVLTDTGSNGALYYNLHNTHWDSADASAITGPKVSSAVTNMIQGYVEYTDPHTAITVAPTTKVPAVHAGSLANC